MSSKVDTVELGQLHLLYIRAVDGPKGAPKAFHDLEARIGSLKGRKFYGIVYCQDDQLQYEAAVLKKPNDSAEALKLLEKTIPAGKYVRNIMMDWQKKIPEIGPTMIKMGEELNVDQTRPELEYYYRENELHLLVPILED